MSKTQQYGELAAWLESQGIRSYMQNPDQIILSSTNPATPDSNCFWATLRDGRWYIGTWLPSAYSVPPTQDIRQICLQIFRSSPTAVYTIDPKLGAKYGLRRLADRELRKLRFV